jgi:error-prone DNA polymerase
MEDFARRTAVDQRILAALAEADAFAAFHPQRRAALWEAHGGAHPLPLSVEPADDLEFPALTPLEAINWDYRRTRHSPRGHPLGPLREELRAQKLPDARTVSMLRDGQRVRYAGMVICRQHPGTASGVTFFTLEDETGFVNLVVWRKVFTQFAALARTQQFLGVSGKIQRQDGVVHIVVDEMWTPEIVRRPASGGSRDFH